MKQTAHGNDTPISRPRRAPLVLRILALCFLGLILIFLLEFGKHTLWGWGLCLLTVGGYLVLRFTLLKRKRGLVKFLWDLPFLAILGVILLISRPPYQRIPAADYPNPEATDVIHIAQGDLTGVYTEDRSVEIYAGIPYAKPPVGDLRFREPQDPDGWDGILACDTFGPKAMQAEDNVIYSSLVDLTFYHYFHVDPMDNYREEMSEDCLYLNVWKPAGDVSELPVLVYIHGGSLTTGASSYFEYRGQDLAKRGILVVTLAYRLNVFGFLADEELAEESPYHTTGNYGLLDQIKALEWVQNNITAFGGDPAKVTICGESAGASCVNALCVSPLAKGLFRYAIAESSGITARVPYHTFRSYEDALDTGASIKKEFGVTSAADLRKIPADQLLKTRYPNNSLTVDGYAITQQPFLTYEAGENNEEALLSGFNAHEADVFLLNRRTDTENYVETLKEVFEEYAEEVAELIPPYERDPDYSVFIDAGGNAKGALNEAVSAAWFTYSHFNWSRYAEDLGIPVYEYCFTKWNPALSCFHAGELPYVFGNLWRHDWVYSPEDFSLSEKMQQYWVNFVKTGNPNGEGLPVWEPFRNSEGKVMEFGDSPGMIPDPYQALYEIIDRQQESRWADLSSGSR
ncbi:MAG: carboxylesterase family protein [Parasporobacterium sp.]|nr:carboxylesterase family protein [Parasporobacterium sp.]